MKKQKAMSVIIMLMALLVASGFSSSEPSDESTKNANAINQQAGQHREKAGSEAQDPGRKSGANANNRSPGDDEEAAPGQENQQEEKSQPIGAGARSNVGNDGNDDDPTAGAESGSAIPALELIDPIALVFGTVFIILTLGLHVVHLVAQSRLRHEIISIGEDVQGIVASQRGIEASKGSEVNDLVMKLNHQKQAFDRLAVQMEEMDRYLAATRDEIAESAAAAGLIAHWIGQIRLQDAKARADDHMSDSERAHAIQALSRCKEVAGANLSRLKPLAQAISAFADCVKSRPHMPAEVASRLEDLDNDIKQFGKWYADLTARLDLLQRGSFSERYMAFEVEQKRLDALAQAGTIPVSEYIEEYRDLLERHFPYPSRDRTYTPAYSEQEAELRKMIADVPEYLMNWFDRFYQLQTQATASQTPGGAAEAQTAAEFLKVQRVARETLGKFDIQPEEIQVGQTSFDRRLHEAALITQTPKYPANTVIAVHSCGFRRVSTGEVLRRPKVVVAGVGAV
ncbi:MAG TPA: nucleotide exchange factor GrpE [Blastocatellia bacterium]|nr:nucleotide exchange factor GrpE [Blastocatellia bacterium]